MWKNIPSNQFKNQQDCPGHIGHIELAVPAYNPLVFSLLMKLLKSKCMHCDFFILHTKKVRFYAIQLLLIKVQQRNIQKQAGKLLLAINLRKEINSIVNAKGEPDEEEQEVKVEVKVEITV